MNNQYDEVVEIIKKYNQEHLLNFYNELTEGQKEKLLNQILNIDFDLISKLYENRNNSEISNNIIEPIDFDIKEEINNETKQDLEKIGFEAINNGEYAICVMAGGQGTRLGHNGPKGTFIVNTNPPMSIFEIIINRLKIEGKKYSKDIFIYFMTSEENNNATVEFFENNDYFGYDKNKVMFFKQGKLPMIDTNGKILLERKDLIKEAADGNGGIFEALHKKGIISHMKQNNIKYLEIKNIDNILFNICDELALGMLIKEDTELLSKSLIKAYPEEKVGVFCKKDNKLGVIEYIEMPQELIDKKDEKGELLYGEAYFGGSNIFNIKALEKIGNEKLPYHTALKKASYIADNGEEVIAEKPNAYKFEAFIFDAFSKMEKYKILRVKREDEFAPIKNAVGVDSPETALKLYNDKYGNK